MKGSVKNGVNLEKTEALTTWRRNNDPDAYIN